MDPISKPSNLPRVMKPLTKWDEFTRGNWLRFAATGVISPRFYLPRIPAQSELGKRSGQLTVEIVSHCWRYERMLQYQLSSLVLHSPRDISILMHVFHADEDMGTRRMLDFFQTLNVPNVQWRWSALPKGYLFRRAIGRNKAALETRADWVWFTDCDLVFHRDCLDSLSRELQNRNDPLVYPRTEYRTQLLSASDNLVDNDGATPSVVDVDPGQFVPKLNTRATGPFQITHGDMARQVGYCNAIPYYQKPAHHFQKAREDRAFRWLLRTQGTPLEIPGALRIRHIEKGRYEATPLSKNLRKSTRKLQSHLRDRVNS